ncbi:small acid-soluble spore protein (thioredoxin-like protein) [Sedimentibacter acidaminivorans]|uniref:Small acid-soluble spore protein (Thioredoxin-like protein) n=1 Tax=Sedimentibacter acidaminivorans TaxID=913099 RepID=A0ABS4G9K9_9FIRM|nr:small acid-soluble spore protein Tlp [Sedimentibacter acidaminivorans]MBP1924363.1 small acid-soluble spore protein (thioredoxin-like protein) [Sedimentibacter acidaminivorans]
MENKPKPDDRRDNVNKIQSNINNTIVNYRKTEELINNVDDDKQKRELEEKNERRKQSLKNMKREIKDEAIDKRNGYK